MEHTPTTDANTNRTKQLESWTRTAQSFPHLVHSMWKTDELVARVQQEERAAGAPVTPVADIVAALHHAFEGENNAYTTVTARERAEAAVLMADAYVELVTPRTELDKAYAMSREVSRLFLLTDCSEAQRESLLHVTHWLDTARDALRGEKTAWTPAYAFSAAANACHAAAAVLDADLQDDLSALEKRLRAAAS